MLKILVAEDDRATLQLFGVIFSRFECVVLEATTGRQTLESARRDKPDLIILDHMMPEMTGYEALQELRRDPAHARIPVVFVTAKRFDKGMQELIRMEVEEFIAKPFTVEQLVTASEKALRRPLPLKKSGP